jgi:hypothetical protein
MDTRTEGSLAGAARGALRGHEAKAMRKRLDAAIAAVDALELAWGIWADSVRQDVEVRHGVAYPVPIEEADAVVLNDREYGTALDCGTALDRVKQALRDVLGSYGQAEGITKEAAIR